MLTRKAVEPLPEAEDKWELYNNQYKIEVKSCQTKVFSIEKPAAPFNGITKMTYDFSQGEGTTPSHSTFCSFKFDKDIDCSKGGFSMTIQPNNKQD
jgi:hypothetical protein